jgi:hypothetical protein
MVLTYPALTAGAKPSLLLTLNGGRNWGRISPPPVPFPSDQDQPQVAWGGGVIAVTDGTRVLTSRTLGLRWSAERLAGVTTTSGTSLYIADLSVTRGRLVALVTTRQNDGSSLSRLYSGSPSGTSMSPVPGLSVTGSETYGGISTRGGLQVALGADYTSEHYWYLRGPATFTPAPVPCPASDTPLPGGAPGGRPVVLCSEAPSSVTLGETAAQVYTAPRLGGTFGAVGAESTVPNPLGFAAASGTAMTLAGAAGLGTTSNAGSTWTTAVSTPNGSFWNGLTFLSPTVGVATGTTVDSTGRIVGYLYRTTDAGSHWTALTLP